MRTIFLVLGAQRSGTSVTSHVLSQFGINFGQEEHFLQDKHNPIFFELTWINQLNNELIRALNHQYTDFFLPVEEDWEQANTAAIETKIQAYWQQEWGDRSVIGVKDPRFSLTLPIWEKLFASDQINVILAFRHPLGFLRSNQKLFDQWEGWDEIRHLNFWLQFNLAAVYFARRHPLYFLNYDRLIANPHQEVPQLAEFFQFDRQPITPAMEIVDPGHYHHEPDQICANTGFTWVDRCYQQLCNQTLTPADYLEFRQEAAALSR